MLRAVMLDVNGTLTDTALLGAPWERPELGDRILQTAVSTAMVDALLKTGDRPFTDHLRAAVEVIAVDEGLDPGEIPAAVSAGSSLPARPGAAAALQTIARTGLRIVGLTNSGTSAGTQTLKSAQLSEHFSDVIGVDDVESFKPDPAVYAHALAQIGAPAREVVLLATHPWDLAGARHCGMRTAWVRHGVRQWPAVFPGPDVQGDDLKETAAALLAFGARLS